MKAAYLYVAGTIALGVYGQMVLKWRANEAGGFPTESGERARWLTDFVLNPWVLTALAAAVVAAFFWMAAVGSLDLSRAYTFLSITFVLVVVLSGVFFDEAITAPKIVGVLMIVAGVAVGSQG